MRSGIVSRLKPAHGAFWRFYSGRSVRQNLTILQASVVTAAFGFESLPGAVVEIGTRRWESKPIIQPGSRSIRAPCSKPTRPNFRDESLMRTGQFLTA